MNEPARDSEQARQARWNSERSRILAARARAERRAEAEGEVLVHCLPPPSSSPPSWFEKTDGQTHVEYSRSAEPSNTVTLPFGPLGRPPEAGAGELTVEEVFAREARRETVRRWTGIELPS
jgi:hypothetical protein